MQSGGGKWAVESTRGPMLGEGRSSLSLGRAVFRLTSRSPNSPLALMCLVVFFKLPKGSSAFTRDARKVGRRLLGSQSLLLKEWKGLGGIE